MKSSWIKQQQKYISLLNFFLLINFVGFLLSHHPHVCYWIWWKNSMGISSPFQTDYVCLNGNAKILHDIVKESVKTHNRRGNYQWMFVISLLISDVDFMEAEIIIKIIRGLSCDESLFETLRNFLENIKFILNPLR